MAGVKEYWMISPEGRMVEVFLLGAEEAYGRPQLYTETDVVPVNVLKDMSIDLSKVFELIETI